jgi:hypothetical protein
MLHALPALLDELERKLITGGDPLPLLGTVRWQEITGWPTNKADALRLKGRLEALRVLISTLEAPLRGTLMRMTPDRPYGRQGRIPLPATLSVRVNLGA